MTATRRDFMRGGAAFFAAAGLGNVAFGKDAGPARLRVGVLSDVHIVDAAMGSEASALSELPASNGKLERGRGVEYRFAVSPANCFGWQGMPIFSEPQF